MFGNTAGANSGFSFGGNNTNTTNNNNSSAGGLFGLKPATSGGLFGTNQPSSASSGFGNTASNTQSGGLFGNNNNTANNTGSGGLFGNNNANNNTATTATSGGMFGNNNNTANTGSGGLFGNNNNNGNSTTNTTSGGLFGSKPAASTGTTGGLFGNNTNTANPTTSGGLFGNNTNTTNNTATTSGGLFGSKPAATTGTTGGLFGNTASSTTGTSGGLFGSKPATTATTTGGLFGAKPAATGATGGLFGLNQQQQQQPQQQMSSGLFNNQNKNSAAPSFAWTQPPAATQPTANPSNPTAPVVKTYAPATKDQLEKVFEQWNPNLNQCQLKAHFYNQFNDQQMHELLQQQRPANETPDDWDAAMRARPLANSYPFKVQSFTEVAQRIETQLDHVARLRLVLQQLNTQQEQLLLKHDLDNATRIQKARARQTTLSRRLLRLATVLALLKLKGYPLLPEEEEISKQFDLLNAKLTNPNSLMAKLSDMYARLALLKDKAEELNGQLDAQLNDTLGRLAADSGVKNEEMATDECITKISKILLQQQIGLNYLNEVVEKDVEVVNKKVPN